MDWYSRLDYFPVKDGRVYKRYRKVQSNRNLYNLKDGSYWRGTRVVVKVRPLDDEKEVMGRVTERRFLGRDLRGRTQPGRET